ncbi:hypothetical protein OA530_04500 [Pelagibacteraceae bacterium]|nr:hypothetical protein [Pelagibacteraceae bacterium]
MNQNKFITRRSYSNEATLFINPGKSQLITKTKMPNMIYSLLIVLIIFTSLLSFSAFAIEPASPKEFWLIDKAKTAPIIFIATKGEIQKDDYLTFLLDSDNCDEVGLTFQMTSVRESLPTKDDLFKVLVKHNPGFEYITKAGIVDNFDMGDTFFSQLIFADILSVENVLEALGDKESFEIELQYAEEENLTDPYLFFDITTNKWNISDFKKHLLDAQTKCRFQYFDQNEI